MCFWSVGAMEKQKSMSSIYRTLAGCRPTKPVISSRRNKNLPPAAPARAPAPRKRRARRRTPSTSSASSLSPSPSPSPDRSATTAAVPSNQRDGEPSRGAPERVAAAATQSPPRTRVLHSKNYPVIPEQPRDTRVLLSPTPPKKVKSEEAAAAEMPVKTAAAVMEPVVTTDATKGVRQKKYFIDPSLEGKTKPQRQYGYEILHSPAFHVVTKILVDAYRIGKRHQSINQPIN